MFREMRRKEKQLTIEECNKILTNFNSVVIFGKAREVVDKEKSEVLMAFLKKFLYISRCSQYEPDGISYVERSTKKTTLMKIEIEHMTGKRGISKNKEIRGKQQ